MVDVATIEKIRGTPIDEMPCGVRARFCPIDEDLGFKFFDCSSTRDANFRRQEYLAEYDIAPMVGHKIDILIDGEVRYGFITERVTPGFANTSHSWTHEQDEEFNAISSEVYKSDKYKDLCSRFREITGYCPKDLHLGNIGYRDNGQMVAIDFSHESF